MRHYQHVCVMYASLSTCQPFPPIRSHLYQAHNSPTRLLTPASGIWHSLVVLIRWFDICAADCCEGIFHIAAARFIVPHTTTSCASSRPPASAKAAAALLLLAGAGTRLFAWQKTQIGKRSVHVRGASPLQPCSRARSCLDSFRIPQTLNKPFSKCTSGALIVPALQPNRVHSMAVAHVRVSLKYTSLASRWPSGIRLAPHVYWLLRHASCKLGLMV